ncbi:MAG TPA: hypothetical protein VN026_18075 [Bacteroidia bacterium]|nr:hypothetical protein [Bacteroidia bacterium]
MAKATKEVKKTVSSKKTSASDTYASINNYLLKNEKKVFLVTLLTGILLAILSFNARISEAHDDALYIEAGHRYVHEFPNYYYTSNAPMYPMFLALLTLIFGTNLIAFKIFSMIFFVIGAVLYYKALDKKVPEMLKFLVFTFLCLNHLVIYYASMTFSEPFYMLVQSAFFYYFSKYNFGESPIGTDLKVDWKKWAVLGLLMMFLTLAKNILIFGIAAIALYYVIRKDYKKMVFAMVSFGVFKLLYELIKSAVWGKSAIQYSSQMSLLLNKDPYDASQGQEDLAGFIGRFTENIHLYLGKRFYQILGFMDENYSFTTRYEANGELVEKTSGAAYLLAFIVLFFMIYGLRTAFKRKNYLIAFLIIFAGTISVGTFVVLQARWDQARFIMVHVPVILLGGLYGLYCFFEKDSFKQKILVAFCLFVTGSMLLSSFKRASDNIPIVSKNLKGDIYFGYTPDWQNYLRCSAWCADSLKKETLVACRKAPMSFVYGKGKKFFPIYSVIKKDTATQQSQPDSALAFFAQNKVTHIMVASLRIDPTKNSGQIINTVHNIIQPIMEKYPNKLKLVHTEGMTEQCYLFEITK